jgi:hypothetical protein
MTKEIVPQLGLASFSCPYVKCRAIASQSWFKPYVLRYDKDEMPFRPKVAELQKFKDKPGVDRDVVAYFTRLASGELFFEQADSTVYLKSELKNISFSRCYSCDGIAVWRADELIYPQNTLSIAPNAEMPPDVLADFLEANEILDKSPRGAAALLRLCVQKLLVHLGGKGKNINDDIGNLVEKGLDKRIQKALDVVRVVGNNAVHPGQIDLRDDKQIATQLFGLVNVIVETLIAQPKHIEEMYETVVPDSVKAQIEKRDSPKQIEHKIEDNTADNTAD